MANDQGAPPVQPAEEPRSEENVLEVPNPVQPPGPASLTSVGSVSPSADSDPVTVTTQLVTPATTSSDADKREPGPSARAPEPEEVRQLYLPELDIFIPKVPLLTQPGPGPSRPQRPRVIRIRGVPASRFVRPPRNASTSTKPGGPGLPGVGDGQPHPPAIRLVRMPAPKTSLAPTKSVEVPNIRITKITKQAVTPQTQVQSTAVAAVSTESTSSQSNLSKHPENVGIEKQAYTFIPTLPSGIIPKLTHSSTTTDSSTTVTTQGVPTTAYTMGTGRTIIFKPDQVLNARPITCIGIVTQLPIPNTPAAFSSTSATGTAPTSSHGQPLPSVPVTTGPLKDLDARLIPVSCSGLMTSAGAFIPSAYVNMAKTGELPSTASLGPLAQAGPGGVPTTQRSCDMRPITCVSVQSTSRNQATDSTQSVNTPTLNLMNMLASRPSSSASTSTMQSSSVTSSVSSSRAPPQLVSSLPSRIVSTSPGRVVETLPTSSIGVLSQTGFGPNLRPVTTVVPSTSTIATTPRLQGPSRPTAPIPVMPSAVGFVSSPSYRPGTPTISTGSPTQSGPSRPPRLAYALVSLANIRSTGPIKLPSTTDPSGPTHVLVTFTPSSSVSGPPVSSRPPTFTFVTPSPVRPSPSTLPPPMTLSTFRPPPRPSKPPAFVNPPEPRRPPFIPLFSTTIASPASTRPSVSSSSLATQSQSSGFTAQSGPSRPPAPVTNLTTGNHSSGVASQPVSSRPPMFVRTMPFPRRFIRLPAPPTSNPFCHPALRQFDIGLPRRPPTIPLLSPTSLANRATPKQPPAPATSSTNSLGSVSQSALTSTRAPGSVSKTSSECRPPMHGSAFVNTTPGQPVPSRPPPCPSTAPSPSVAPTEAARVPPLLMTQCEVEAAVDRYIAANASSTSPTIPTTAVVFTGQSTSAAYRPAHTATTQSLGSAPISSVGPTTAASLIPASVQSTSRGSGAPIQFPKPTGFAKKARGSARPRAPSPRAPRPSTPAAESPTKSGRGRRGSKKQNLRLRNVESTNEDDFIDVGMNEPTPPVKRPPVKPTKKKRVPLPAAAPKPPPPPPLPPKIPSEWLKDLPTNMPIEAFEYLERDIDDSDDGDDMNDSIAIINAGVYTAEEISLIITTKSTKLLDAYEDQFEDLKDDYKLMRSNYLRNRIRLLKAKVPFTTNPHHLVRDEQLEITDDFIREEHKQYKYYQKLLQYHKNNSQRAVLHKMALQKFQEIKDKEKETENVAPLDPSNIENIAETDVEDFEDKSYHEFCEEVRRMNTVERIEPPKVVVRCEYAGAQGNEPRCSDPALPLAKFCLAHIMNSGKQHLFKPCGRKLASGSTCDIPVLGIIDKLGCPMHHMPVVRDLSEDQEAKKSLQAKIRAQPKVRSRKKAVAPLEKLVVDQAVSVDHIRELITNNRVTKNDTDDSEEFEDELTGLGPGPGYMTIKF